MRQSIMNTYKELMAVKNDNRWPSNTPSISPDPMVVDYTNRNGRREGLLYNNRIFFGHTNPSEKVKDQYDINRTWIISNFKK